MVIDVALKWFSLWIHIIFKPKSLPPRRLSVTREPSFSITVGDRDIVVF